MISYRTLAISFSALALLACKLDLGLGEASQNLVTASENLHRAAKDVDPLTLRKQLEENKQLREQLALISQKYQTSMGAGALEVTQQAVYWRLVEYSGAVRVITRIGATSDLVLYDDVLPKREATLTLQMAGIAPVGVINGPLAEQRIRAAFKSYLEGRLAPPLVPAPPQIWLNPRFPESGLHTISVEVTPIELADKRWNLVWELISKNADGSGEKVLARYDMSSSNLGAELGRAHHQRALLRIRLAS